MVVRATQLTMAYPAQNPDEAPIEVLHGINLVIAAGEMVAIVGPPDSGKSTLLHCLAGLERSTTGRVELVGVDVTAASDASLAMLRRTSVAFIFQAYNLGDSLNALGNAAQQMNRVLGARAHKNDAATNQQHRRPPNTPRFSACPRVVFADEPTAALDAATSARVLGMLRDVVTGGTTVVFTTDDLAAAILADRVLVLRDGRISAELREAKIEQLSAALSQQSLPARA
ncbi:MAG: hypothetical protein B5766_04025 [Candidatus Lumbricidophila eiseniae]|uniref:ABC transporter domain-containing protein n=1 Tax=Candidatus Lumbricidiphila eiseniae TaxID=1969409 RepID=A0A2A6FSP5_9MICO|nr:MAG: hypothetical protein B5766_04025 [Candidatus Lumbricidophila eiseniae]